MSCPESEVPAAGSAHSEAVCPVCFRHCKLKEDALGACMARRNVNGTIVCDNYGKISSIALDPIEKKPLARFYPGRMILSVGSYGCNLRCPFCQNHEISYDRPVELLARGSSASAAGDRNTGRRLEVEKVAPQELVSMALELVPRGNIGIAFTYNEPLVGYELVLDTARLAREKGLETVLVTNGTATGDVEDKLLPWISAMNIDLKAFTDRFYKEFIDGDRAMVMDFIERAAVSCHVELTTLIIPGENDSEEEMDALSVWIAGVSKQTGCDIPLHITRFFPRFRLTDRGPTDTALVRRLAEAAGRHLSHVYLGNM